MSTSKMNLISWDTHLLSRSLLRAHHFADHTFVSLPTGCRDAIVARSRDAFLRPSVCRLQLVCSWFVASPLSSVGRCWEMIFFFLFNTFTLLSYLFSWNFVKWPFLLPKPILQILMRFFFLFLIFVLSRLETILYYILRNKGRVPSMLIKAPLPIRLRRYPK